MPKHELSPDLIILIVCYYIPFCSSGRPSQRSTPFASMRQITTPPPDLISVYNRNINYTIIIYEWASENSTLFIEEKVCHCEPIHKLSAEFSNKKTCMPQIFTQNHNIIIQGGLRALLNSNLISPTNVF